MNRQAVDKKELPDEPGIYQFLGPEREILYIGKATSLRNRVKSYFSGDLLETRGPGIAQMVKRAADVRVRETDSVLEALILEANLIKKHEPPYNSREKDDKSFNHLVITNETFPRVLVVRGRDLPRRFDEREIKYSFGPFPEGGIFKEALRLVRKIFPFRDEKCTPGQGRPCFNRQLGLCPGVCTGEIGAREYGRTIQHLRLFFEGKKKQLLARLEREMRAYAKVEAFEKAAHVRRQIFALKHINDVSLLKREAGGEAGERGVRIEGYDVAHTAEQERVGVMVVLEDGKPKKSDYRQFKIKRTGGGDTDALAEVLKRRLTHDEWPLPELFVVDGGTAQRNAARKILGEFGYMIPVVSVVKDERHKPRAIEGGTRALRGAHEDAILVANSEAHRFALAFHKKRRGKMR